MKKVDPAEYYSSLTKIPAEERVRLHKELRNHHGAIAEIARRVKPKPRNRATITLWFQGRVQSSPLDRQVPKIAREYLAELIEKKS